MTEEFKAGWGVGALISVNVIFVSDKKASILIIH